MSSNAKKKRFVPNILVTGTPGVGKSTLCKKLADLTSLQWLDVSKIATESGCLEEYDDVYKCHILDEDKLLDHLEERINDGGYIVDYHSCELFPERWFDLVFVLRTDNTVLYDRLVERGYSGKKLEDNVDCEIFQTILEEAGESYKTGIIFELKNDSLTQMQENIERICSLIQSWIDDQNGDT